MKKISVIMGVFNCECTLSDAITSLLNQTYTNWQLIMCDDGSEDNTYDVALLFQQKYPEKIILLKNSCNMGLNYTLNRCLEEADGDYIARMDGDDICAPDRFEKESFILDTHPDVSIVSCSMTYFDELGEWGQCTVIEKPENIHFLHGTPFCHAPAMVRKDAYLAVNGYTVDQRYLRVEDYDLWIKMYANGFRGLNILESLYSMRDDRDAYNRRKFKYRINEARIRIKAVRCLNLPIYGYIYALRPIITGLLPTRIYYYLHKKRLRRT